MVEALEIHVKGIVQGVGFRPFVYRLAQRYLLSGWVLNAADGVHIHAEGEEKHLDEFVMELSEHAPSAAQVTEIDIEEVPLEPFNGFEIRFSEDDAVEETTLVSPDIATCPDCVAELFDEDDRRYRYPFINCTNCGPRFTIIDELPYDRASTSMRDFSMCAACQAEYDDPADRRFHAQPDACFACGPTLSLYTKKEGADPALPLRASGALAYDLVEGKDRASSDRILATAVELLLAGRILAVKGLGGYHLVCDANNAEAVRTLRERKHRFGKAFAVMMESVEAAASLCHIGSEEEAILAGAERPIVLLRKRDGAHIGEGVADGLPELGVMLPYTPVQHLLLHDFVAASLAQAGTWGVPVLVMTSGNIHDEPIVIDDAEALERLSAIADAIIANDRRILTRFDDSVVRVIRAASAGHAVQFIRRSRGYAPTPLRLPDASQTSARFLAVGPEQKNTFALTRQAEAFVSQHIGDVENAETMDAWLETKGRFERLFEIEPTGLACDAHPEYLTTKWAHEAAQAKGLPLVEVQHHHAHIVSVMAENGLSDAVCGIAFDGTGFGADGNIWGGEVLLSNLVDYERFANLAYVPMPGGSACVKHPLRMAYGVLWQFDLLEHEGARTALAALGEEESRTLGAMIEQGINTPYASSVGRLFDAASALLGICTAPTYEGEPAILLEAALSEDVADAHGEGGSGACSRSDSPRVGPDGRSPSGSSCGTRLVQALDPSSGDMAPADALEPVYRIAITKNTATEGSTAHDTSVVLFDPAPVFAALLDDIAQGVPVGIIAKRFHDAFVDAIVEVAMLAQALYGMDDIVLTGGVFMNRYLIEHALAALEHAGFTVAINRELPPNDGCISYGQAVVASALEATREMRGD